MPSELFDATTFRRVLGHFATGIVVVAADTGAGPIGFAANSFTSVSLDPPLVAFCADITSRTWPLLRATGAFAISILRADQEAIGRTFGSRGVDRFAGLPLHHSPQGHPVIDGALAWLDCTVETVHPAGDHELILARVVDLSAGVDEDAQPLLFFRGRYVRVSTS